MMLPTTSSPSVDLSAGSALQNSFLCFTDQGTWPLLCETWNPILPKCDYLPRAFFAILVLRCMVTGNINTAVS